jgi:hypothetical protein
LALAAAAIASWNFWSPSGVKGSEKPMSKTTAAAPAMDRLASRVVY